MDSPQLIGDISMSVQKIELEEVQMLQASDTALEAAVAAVGLTSTTLPYSGAFGCSTAVEWCS